MLRTTCELHVKASAAAMQRLHEFLQTCSPYLIGEQSSCLLSADVCFHHKIRAIAVLRAAVEPAQVFQGYLA